MSQTMYRHTVVFVVKVWAEYLEQDPPCWRGEVSHVESEQCTLFASLDDLLAFINETTMPLVDSGSGEPET